MTNRERIMHAALSSIAYKDFRGKRMDRVAYEIRDFAQRVLSTVAAIPEDEVEE